jgi:hypothetical protein
MRNITSLTLKVTLPNVSVTSCTKSICVFHWIWCVKNQSITIGMHYRQRFTVEQHVTLTRTMRIFCGCYVSTSLFIFCGVGLFVVLRCGRSSVTWFVCSCLAIWVLVVRSVSKSGGLVHVRNRYNTESVFVLEHADTPKPVNAACEVLVYQKESHTTNPTSGHTWGLNMNYRPK